MVSYYKLKPEVKNYLFPKELHNVEIIVSSLPSPFGSYYGMVKEVNADEEIFFRYFNDKLEAFKGCQQFLTENYSLMTHWKEGG